MLNLLDKKTKQPSKFRTKDWVEINNDSHGRYSAGSQIKFKSFMVRSSLCDYSDAYILVSGTIIITGAGADDAAKRRDERD